MFVYQPVFLVVFFDSLRSLRWNLLKRQDARVMIASGGKIHQIFPEILELLRLPGVATLIIGNPEEFFFE